MKPKPIGINHVALEVGDLDAALAFVDPWGNRIEVVDHASVQLTKTAAVLKTLGGASEKTAEVRDKGLSAG